MSIDHANLSRLDLNLLVAFDALLTERSVTRAAARVHIGQSAMSHALARLRDLLRDELLVRSPDGMRPTPRALALAGPVRSILGEVQGALLRPAEFDPALAERAFRIGIPDSIEVALMPALLAAIRSQAPGITVRVRSMDRFAILDELDGDRLDLGVGSFTEGDTHHKRRHLYADTYLCLYDPGLVEAKAPISLDDYIRLPHVLASLREDAHGVVDDALAKLRLSRTIALATPHFIAVPFILKRAPVISTLPSKLARFFSSQLDLALSPVPLELPGFSISMLWHASYDADPAHRWLRQLVARVAAETALDL